VEQIVEEVRRWNYVHDFHQGWGWAEHIPDNEVLIEQFDSGVRVVRNRRAIRHVWLGEAQRRLPGNSFDANSLTDDDISALYDIISILRLLDPPGQPGQIAQFSRIRIPLVRRIYPGLIAETITGVQPMTQPSSLAYYARHVRPGSV
jgi:hypothetical protein